MPRLSGTVKVVFEVVAYVDAEGDSEQDIVLNANDIAYCWDGAELGDRLEDYELLHKKSELTEVPREIIE